ncbi:RNA polymerase sigma factor [Pedobacter africanus]|uniref:RNA polymerase sigma-70 factor, ECF subfamily n=1 Tax=Pedobacter africanus TaxID=151894 RepID=A0A1W1ZWF5_9SPHI|nr:RNA polymerase sigma-70 factor [Pedobacter africanus]SMC52795.1 RNA polymerase sigma-70 factor, ECF subfamily [Pedobacter africanus]
MSAYSKYTDTELSKLFNKGDALAYRAIYDRYWQLLFRFARKLLQDSTSAEDVVQDVFVVFWDKRDQMVAEMPLAGFLYKLTRNKILDLVRHTHVANRYLEQLHQIIQSGEVMPDQLYIEKELYDIVEREIKRLPEKMRQVFEMSRKEFKSSQEIADELGISQQTVKNQISNAIRTLKDKMGDSLNIFLIIF